MQASIANYSTPSEIQMDQSPLATKYCYSKDRFRSSSLFVSIENPSPVFPGLNSRIFKLLDEFGTLTDNWDEDSAIAPDSMVLLQAKYICQILEIGGQKIYNAAPGPNGEVMIDLRNQSNFKSVELIFYPDRSVAVFFPNDNNAFQKEFRNEQLPNILEWLNKK